MKGQVLRLILLTLSLTSCQICSDTYSEGQLKLKAWPYNDSTNGTEITVGETLDIRIENLRSSFYAASCYARSFEFSMIEVLPSEREDVIRIQGRTAGQAIIRVTCTGKSGGEQALCDSRFKDTGSITVTITETKMTRQANNAFSDSSNSHTSF